MKKTLVALLLAVASLPLAAQRTPHAIGLHFGGSTIDLEYQYHFSQKNFLDVTAGVFDFGDGFALQGLYNWNFQQWSDWTPNFATWKVWGGVGAGLGVYTPDGESGMMLGPAADVGFGFTVKKVPLTVGIDYRPMLALVVGKHSDIVANGFYNFGLTMTYRF